MEIASREDSPAVAVLAIPAQPSTKKRKHAALSGAAPSPAPSDRGGTPNPSNDNLVLTSRHDLSKRPRLTISRHPGFLPIAPGSQFCTTEPLCMNRFNFRYTPAGLSDDPGNPFRTIESAPAQYRVSWEDRSAFVKVTPDGLSLKGDKGFRSARCNAPVREGKWYMEVTVGLGGGDKASDSQRREGSHVRLGWARREAPLNGPVGLDGYSYGLRDKTGEKVHLSRPRPYSKPFKSGDVVGMYISLPSPRRQPNKKDPYDPAHVKRERIAIEFKGQEYFESFEYSQSKEMLALMEASDRGKTHSSTPAPPPTKKSATVKNLPSTSRPGKAGPPDPAPMRPLPTLGQESCVAFFVNGDCQGIAFRDLYDYLPLRTPPHKAHEKKRSHRDGYREHKENPFDDGSLGYYPMISLFNGAEVTLNPGPNFAFPPPPDIDAVLVSGPGGADVKPDGSAKWRPLSERYPEYIEEQYALDRLEAVEAKKTKPVETREEKAPPKETKEHRETPRPRPKPKEKKEDKDKDREREKDKEKDKDKDKDKEPPLDKPRNELTAQEKLEIHRAKRRAQAARRRERAKKEKEEADARAKTQEKAKKKPEGSQPSTSASASASVPAESEMEVDAELALLADGRASTAPDTPMDTPNAGAPQSYSSPPIPGSVGDVQAYWTGTPGDNSEYNTEYEDMPGEHDQGADSEMGIDEEIAQLS